VPASVPTVQKLGGSGAGVPGAAPYDAAKAGVVGMSRRWLPAHVEFSATDAAPDWTRPAPCSRPTANYQLFHQSKENLLWVSFLKHAQKHTFQSSPI
jgi:NAD(P)-dependent dehydrogenase (short-subunit alcohol dehydrogenase family)